MKNTRLVINIWKLENFYEDWKTTKYFMKFYPGEIIYLPDIINCNKFIQDYAYKESTVDSLDIVITRIKKILTQAAEYDNRVDIIFDLIDIAHLPSTEKLNDGTGYFICQKEGVSFNRELNSEEMKIVENGIRDYYEEIWKTKKYMKVFDE